MNHAGHSPACGRAEALVARGRIEDAHRGLEDAAGQGDGLAALTLAHWRLAGHPVRRDLGLARHWFGRAAALGQDEAGPIHIALLANGAGGTERRWAEAVQQLHARAAKDMGARLQAALLDRMALDAAGDPLSIPVPTPVRSIPDIGTIGNFLTPEECAYLTWLGEPSFQPSVVVHPATGAMIRDPIRTSDAAAFPFVAEDPALHAINRRIAAVTGTTYAQGEPLQLLRYAPGQEYKLHSDALPDGHNQRALTLLVYLNEAYEGGETSFPDAQFRYRGRIGDAILFRNILPDGRPDPAARHAGLPVRSGRKLILSKWIRSQPLDLAGPPGRPL